MIRFECANTVTHYFYVTNAILPDAEGRTNHKNDSVELWRVKKTPKQLFEHLRNNVTPKTVQKTGKMEGSMWAYCPSTNEEMKKEPLPVSFTTVIFVYRMKKYASVTNQSNHINNIAKILMAWIHCSMKKYCKKYYRNHGDTSQGRTTSIPQSIDW